MVTKVFIHPVRTASGYRYDIEHDGQIVVSRSRVPFCDAARWCAWVGKDGILEMWRYGGSYPAMKGEIGRYAGLTVRETDRVSPRFVKWRPFEREPDDDATTNDVITSANEV